jgi:hypothetical protein
MRKIALQEIEMRELLCANDNMNCDRQARRVAGKQS